MFIRSNFAAGLHVKRFWLDSNLREKCSPVLGQIKRYSDISWSHKFCLACPYFILLFYVEKIHAKFLPKELNTFEFESGFLNKMPNLTVDSHLFHRQLLLFNLKFHLYLYVVVLVLRVRNSKDPIRNHFEFLFRPECN